MIIPHFRPIIFNPSLLANNLLFSWGRNIDGRLGINSSDSEYFADHPIKIDSEIKFKEVSVSSRAGLAIRQDGTLWSWGKNENFLLGIGVTSTAVRSSPVQIGSDSDWKSIKSSGTHALGLKEDGSLWAWGLGASGRLGLGNTSNRSAPTRIGLLSDWSLISVGASQSLAIKTDGSLWSWGSGQLGQLGLGDVADRNSPVRIGIDSDWASVEGGQRFSLAIKTNGTLWSWGDGNAGKLGRGNQTSMSSPVQVGLLSDWSSVSSFQHSLAIKTDGSLWAWGTGTTSGALGDGTATNRSSPVPVMSGDTWKYAKAGYRHSVAIKSDGTMWAWGNNEGARLGASILPYIRSPIAVANDQSWNKDKVFSCRNDSFFAINNDDKLVAFGYNGHGSLGLGDVIDRSSPVLVNNDSWSDVSSWDHTLAIKTNGTLWSWGEVAFGKTGNNIFFNFVESSSPIQVGLLSDWSKVNAGENHSLAIKTDGTLWAWGRGSYGLLGTSNAVNRSSPVQVGLLSDWYKVSGGRYHSLAIKTDGTIWSWGRNNQGQLGLGLSTLSSSNRSSPVQIGSLSSWSKISSGNNHCMAIKNDGTLWAWGDNGDGQLGLGNISDRSSPVQVGLLSDWQSVSCGRSITAAIKTDGTLWAWGYNEDGRLGINSLVNRSSPVPVGSLSNWAKVYCGRNLMAITNDNKLYGAGPGVGGSLAIKTIVNTSSPVQVGTSSSWKKVAAYTFNLGIK